MNPEFNICVKVPCVYNNQQSNTTATSSRTPINDNLVSSITSLEQLTALFQLPLSSSATTTSEAVLFSTQYEMLSSCNCKISGEFRRQLALTYDTPPATATTKGNCGLCRTPLSDACIQCVESRSSCAGIVQGQCAHSFHAHCFQHHFQKSNTCPECLQWWQFNTGVIANTPDKVNVHVFWLNQHVQIPTVVSNKSVNEFVSSDLQLSAAVSRYLIYSTGTSIGALQVVPGQVLFSICGCASSHTHQQSWIIHIDGLDKFDLPLKSTDTVRALKVSLQSLSGYLPVQYHLYLGTVRLAANCDSKLLTDVGVVNDATLTIELRSVTEMYRAVDVFTPSGCLIQSQEHFQQWSSGQHNITVWINCRHLESVNSSSSAGGGGGGGSTAFGLQDVFGACLDWQPLIMQSPRGLSCFLSSLYVFCKHLTQDAGQTQRVLGYFRALTQSSPAALAMKFLIERRIKYVRAEWKSLLSNTIFSCIQSSATSGLLPETLFEHSRVFFHALLEDSRVEHAILELPTYYTNVALSIALENDTIEVQMLRAMNFVNISNGMLYHCTEAPIPPAKMRSWRDLLRELIGGSTTPAHAILRILAASQLSNRHAPLDSLTRDARGFIVVFSDRGNSCNPQLHSTAVTLFSPLRLGEDTVNTEKLVESLQQLASAADNDDSSFVDARAPIEAVLVVLDCSASMHGKADFDLYEADQVEIDIEQKKEGTACVEPEQQRIASGEGLSEWNKYYGRQLAWDQVVRADMTEALNWFIRHSSFEIWKTLAREQHHAADMVAQKILLPLIEFWYDIEPSSLKYKRICTMVASCTAPFADLLLNRSSIAINTLLPDYSLTCTSSSSLREDDEFICPVPDSFLCPISRELMKDPVLIADTYSYERAFIQEWFVAHDTSPMSGLPVNKSIMRTNATLLTNIREWCEQYRRKPHVEEAPEGKQPQVCVPIQIKSFNGDILHFTQFTSRSTILSIKQMIAQTIPCAMDSFDLIFQNQRLSTTANHYLTTLSDVTTQACATTPLYCFALGRNFGGSSASRTAEEMYQIVIKTSTNNEVCKFVCRASDTLAHVKYLSWNFFLHSPQWADKRVYTDGPWSFGFYINTKDIGDGYINGHPCTADLKTLESYYTRMEHHQITCASALIRMQTLTFTLMTGMNRGLRTSNVASVPTKHLSRMETCQQLFHAFINRSLAYDFPIHIGLLKFGTASELVCHFTPVYEQFRQKIDALTCTGNTALYDALDLACDKLLAFKQLKPQHFGARLRIFCLSDGADTSSRCAAFAIAKKLQTHQVIVDVMQIGKAPADPYLKAICLASGGLCFEPKALSSALTFCELETVISLNERPAAKFITKITSQGSLNSLLYAQRMQQQWSIAKGNLPPRKQTYDCKQRVTSIDATIFTRVEEVLSVGDPATVSAASNKRKFIASERSSASIRRIMKELQQLMQKPHVAFDIYPQETNIAAWTVILEGPSSTPYVDGVWRLSVEFPASYPTAVPEIRFSHETPICHSNVNAYGKICHSIFDRNYSPDLSVSQLLECVYGLLLVPDHSQPVDSVLATQAYNSSGLYETRILNHKQQWAMKRTREQWRIFLLQ